MARKRNSKSQLKQVYLIRRVVAVLIIILIFVAIFTRCSSKGTTGKENSNENQLQTTTQTETNVVNGLPDNNLNGENPDATTPTANEGETPAVGEASDSVMLTNERNIQNEYDEYADVEYKENVFYFNFKGDTRTMVTSRDDDQYAEEFKAFWENFKYELTKTSETLAETVQPRIELHVIDPKDDRSSLLLIKDGSTLFDSTDM